MFFFHFHPYIPSYNALPLETFVTKDHYKNIVSILEDMSDEIRLKPIKEQLGEGYSWFEIRCAKEYWEKNQKSN